MKYLILIHLDEKELDALPPDELNALNKNHLRFNDELRASGHFVEAEALEPARTTSTVKVRGGRPSVMDGPFAERNGVRLHFPGKWSLTPSRRSCSKPAIRPRYPVTSASAQVKPGSTSSPSSMPSAAMSATLPSGR